MKSNREHIVVVGGGPVGLGFALAASRLAGFDVTVVERNALSAGASSVPDAATFDQRVYALSPSSVAFLGTLGVWEKIAPARRTPIDAMRVFADADARAQPLPEIHFDHGAPLAHMVEHQTLMAALVAAVAETPVEVIERETVTAINTPASAPTHRHITLAGGALIEAHLLVGADGRASRTRLLAGIDVIEKDYKSDALVANFHAEKPHNNIAVQWFANQGVLACLPLPQNQISIVWSTPVLNARALHALDDAAFADQVAAASHHLFGRLRLASPREAIGLKRILAAEWVQPGLALIGDAAHAIHPLTGQGVNLGFGDARHLCAVLAAKGAFSRAGELLVLRRYARQRAEPTALMAETTDCLQQLFWRDDSVAKWLRRDGFGWFGRMPAVKRAAMEYALRT